jgi:TFIIIC subunit triple barrel domain
LDLTSLNGGLKSNIPGKRPLDRPEQTGRTKPSNADVWQQSTPIEDNISAMPIRLQEPFGPAPSSMQVLDIASDNPIVSYKNEVYSCTWFDMVGTNMFFTPPAFQWPPPEEPVELVGTSRIRLIGHKAKTAVKEDAAAGSFKSSGYTNAIFKRQAEFLEKLKKVKKAKGDKDVVRTDFHGRSRTPSSVLAAEYRADEE